MAGRVPVLAAGGILTPEQADQALETGIAMVAIGRGRIINPDWVWMARDEHKVETAIDPAAVAALAIPPKLWTVIESLKGWIPIKPEQGVA